MTHPIRRTPEMQQELAQLEAAQAEQEARLQRLQADRSVPWHVLQELRERVVRTAELIREKKQGRAA